MCVRRCWKLTVILMMLMPACIVATPLLDTTPEDNSLWRSISNCKDMSLDCMKNQFVGYLNSVFDTEAHDVQVASFLNFHKNDNDYSAWRSAKSDVNEGHQQDDDGDEDDSLEGMSPRAANPLEEVTRSVYDKIKKFFVTHDVQLALPDFIAEGASMRISPRAFQDGGALLRVDLEDDTVARSASVGTPRIFFKRIRKFIGERLMWALGALLLVVKLLSLKFMFFLPVIMGVAAAKKLLLKVILFIFPFMGHVFKLCPYYAPTKFHHHHHQISHLHRLPPHLHDLHAGGIELDHPPPGWHEGGHDHHHHPHLNTAGGYADDLGYYSEGPAFGANEIGLRRKQQASVHPDDDDAYSHPGQQLYSPDVKPYLPKNSLLSEPAKLKAGPLSTAEIENMVLKAEKETMLKARLQEEQKRVEVENKLLQDKIKNSLKLQEKLKIQSMVAKQTSKIAAAYQPPQMPPPAPTTHLIQPNYVNSYLPQSIMPPLPHTQTLYAPVVHHQPPTYNNPAMLTAMQTQLHNSANSLNALGISGKVSPTNIIRSPQMPPNGSENANTFDPFYSPILKKIDKIFDELVILDEHCRERLVCNMYSEPEKYSPHSNLISAELSRDASELQKPTSSNFSVIRFYKYVQAARDGQDKRSCSTLYPECSLNF